MFMCVIYLIINKQNLTIHIWHYDSASNFFSQKTKQGHKRSGRDAGGGELESGVNRGDYNDPEFLLNFSPPFYLNAYV